MDSYVLLVLYVDDNPSDIDLMKMAYDENEVSFQMKFIENGVVLLDMLRKKEIATQTTLILLDHNMPMMTGLEALEKIKNDPILAKIPIVLFTTSTAPKTIKRAYELGAMSYLPKSMSYECLGCLIRMIDNFWIKPFVKE